MLDLLKRIELTQTTYRHALKTLFVEGCQYIFESYPSLESFTWHQHTPLSIKTVNYFVLGAHPENIEIEAKEELPYAELLKVKISKLLLTLGDDLQLIFGDNVKITMKRNDEMKVENYYG